MAFYSVVNGEFPVPLVLRETHANILRKASSFAESTIDSPTPQGDYLIGFWHILSKVSVILIR